jgi:hypothetical protein
VEANESCDQDKKIDFRFGYSPIVRQDGGIHQTMTLDQGLIERCKNAVSGHA